LQGEKKRVVVRDPCRMDSNLLLVPELWFPRTIDDGSDCLVRWYGHGNVQVAKLFILKTGLTFILGKPVDGGEY
jgi:hypothetical protein